MKYIRSITFWSPITSN